MSKIFAFTRTKQRFVCFIVIKLLMLSLPIYILSPNISVLCLFKSPSSRHSLYIDFVNPYIILPYVRTKELVSMLKTLHGTRLK